MFMDGSSDSSVRSRQSNLFLIEKLKNRFKVQIEGAAHMLMSESHPPLTSCVGTSTRLCTACVRSPAGKNEEKKNPSH